MKEASLAATALTISLGEGNDGADLSDARYSFSAPPPAWISTSYSPLHRHRGGANYAFADGHVKWLKPALIGTASVKRGAYTFSIN